MTDATNQFFGCKTDGTFNSDFKRLKCHVIYMTFQKKINRIHRNYVNNTDINKLHVTVITHIHKCLAMDKTMVLI